MERQVDAVDLAGGLEALQQLVPEFRIAFGSDPSAGAAMGGDQRDDVGIRAPEHLEGAAHLRIGGGQRRRDLGAGSQVFAGEVGPLGDHRGQRVALEQECADGDAGAAHAGAPSSSRWNTSRSVGPSQAMATTLDSGPRPSDFRIDSSLQATSAPARPAMPVSPITSDEGP